MQMLVHRTFLFNDITPTFGVKIPSNLWKYKTRPNSEVTTVA